MNWRDTRIIVRKKKAYKILDGKSERTSFEK
jgi:hypothetical protein